ncbi:MAG: archaeosine biosynthesis radical SAM protein RaSEA [Candidatus Hodarchaeota archaeon]
MSSQPKLWSNIEETEKEVIITIVIPTRGCSWALSESGGCSVCGYINDSSRNHNIPSDLILNRVKKIMDKNSLIKPIQIKIFNSGSFFDDDDVPRKLRFKLIQLIKNYSKIRKISVESRPQYLLNNFKEVEHLKNQLSPVMLEIGIGLESSNNCILRDCWNKGFTLEDYAKTTQKIRSLGVKIKTYILVKPPFLTELEAINDTIKTVQDAVGIGTDIISLNPCNVQNGTLVAHLFRDDSYQPPWLWSVFFIIKSIKNLFPHLEVICEPTAAGKHRGVHNCGKCDDLVLRIIQKTIKNEPVPKNLSKICSCFSRWKLLVESPIEAFRIRNLSKLRKLSPLNE